MTKASKILLIGVVLTVAVFACAGLALAAEGDWNSIELNRKFRGPGSYLSWMKILACWLLFALWTYTTDWVSTDCVEMKKLNYLRWNPIVFGTFAAAFVLVWMIPYFWVGYSLLVVAYVAPLVTYIVYRNAAVTNDERVMTPEHLRYWLSVQLGKIGVKISPVKADPNEAGMAVKLIPEGGPDERSNNVRLLLARQTNGLRAAGQLVTEGLANRASAVMLDYGQQTAAMRLMVDGVWISREAKPRETADPALEALKLLCGLNPQDRQNRQEGTFAAEYQSARYSATFASQGISTGERVVLQFEDKKVRMKSFDELGMRSKLQEQLREILNAPKGLVIFSAIPEGGLRTTFDVMLRSCDRFTREFIALEDEGNRFTEVENIPVTTYNGAAGESPADLLPKLLRMQPNVVVMRDLVNAQTAGLLCREASQERVVLTSTRAVDCAEALLRILSIGVPPAELAKAVTAVVNQRLVRKLCDACKEAYAPTPEILAQLGIPEGRVKAFHRPPQPRADAPKEPCKACGAIGYLGRTAIFELLVVGDAVRKVLANNPKLDLLRQAARKDGMKSLQEEGALLVVKGETSLPELIRVLKQ